MNAHGYILLIHLKNVTTGNYEILYPLASKPLSTDTLMTDQT